MRQCCKVTVNNSLIRPRGLSARHCRPFPFPGCRARACICTSAQRPIGGARIRAPEGAVMVVRAKSQNRQGAGTRSVADPHRPRREGGASSLEILRGALAGAGLSSGPGTGGSEVRLVRGFLCCKARNRVKRWERVSVGQLTEAPGNSKNSTPFWGRLQKALFLATSIVEREHAWNRQWIF